MDLFPFFQWCYQTSAGEAIRNSTWLFPVIEAVHLLGFGGMVGAALLVDMRLLGIGLIKQPVAQLSMDTEPWLLGSVVVMFVSGVPLFLCEAIKCYYSDAFWVKMICLFAVLVFTFTFRRRVTGMASDIDRPLLCRITALTSVVLWFGVAWGGRWIGYS